MVRPKGRMDRARRAAYRRLCAVAMVPFFDGANREAARVFVHQLIDKQLAIEDERASSPAARAPSCSPGKPSIGRWGSPTCGTVGARTRPRTSSCAGCSRSITSSSGRPSDGSRPRPTRCNGSRRSASTGEPSRTACTGRKADGRSRVTSPSNYRSRSMSRRRRLSTSMRASPPIASCARGAWPTRPSGPRSGRGRSPCTWSPSARAQRQRTAPRPS